eukprot:c29716_g1_i1 orf=317-2224(-)
MDGFTQACPSRCFTTRLMDALFFSDAVYGSTPGAVVSDLERKLGKVDHVMDRGFDSGEQQAVFAGRSSNGHVVVACRGTACLRDVMQDLKFFHVRLPYANGTAGHWGFAERAKSIPIELFCNLLSMGEEVVFTGHSLGGAVASLLSLRVLESVAGLHQPQVQCITFGSPLFASRSLADLIDSKYKDVFVHVVCKKDFVPRILPFMSFVQKLLHANEDHLEGLLVLGKGLEYLNWLPVWTLMKNIVQKIPSPFKFIVRCFVRLAMAFHSAWPYAFTGHVMILDAASKAEDVLASSIVNDPNMWNSQLNFALGMSFDASMIEHHAISSYYNGVIQTLSQMVVRHNKANSLDRTLSAEFASILPRNGRERSLSVEELGSDANSNMQIYENPNVLCCSSNLTSIDGITCDDGNGVSKGASPTGSSGSYSVSKLDSAMEDSTFLSENHSTCTLPSSSKGDTAHGTALRSELSKSENARTLFGKRENFIRRLGCCAAALRQFIPFTWENVLSGFHLQEVQAVYLGSAMLRDLGYSNQCSQSALVKLPAPLFPVDNSDSKPAVEHLEFETESILLSNKDSPAHATCEVEKVIIKQSLKKMPQKHFKLGWIIGAIGRVARHLRVLDNLCIFTFIGMILSNLHG